MIFQFAKYHGSENDFLVFDDRKETFPVFDEAYIQFLCKRNTGVGADGLLLLQSSEKADFRMRIFNSDGSEAAMCGNGLRCLVDFAHRQGIAHSSIEVGNRIAACQWNEDSITTDLGPYEWIHPLLSIPPLDVHVVDTGVPHAVIFVENHDQFPLLAPQIRSHFLLGEKGANINFAAFKEGKFYVRTFERGIEAETRSCGSGAAAVAIAAKLKYKEAIASLVTVVPLSQEELIIEILSKTVRLSGKATCVFHGSVAYRSDEKCK